MRAPPPTMCTTSTVAAGEPLRRRATRPRWASGEAVQDAAHHLRRVVPATGWPVSPAGLRRCGRACRPAAGRPGRRGRRRRANGRQPAAASQQRVRSTSARRPQARMALLQQPQAHDVAQVADGAVDADLVGEVGPPALLGQHRGVELDADQRPGAAGDVGEAGRCRPGTPTTAEAVSCEPTAVTGIAVEPGRPRPRRSRSGRRRARAAAAGAPGRMPSRRDQVGRPVAGA